MLSITRASLHTHMRAHTHTHTQSSGGDCKHRTSIGCWWQRAVVNMRMGEMGKPLQGIVLSLRIGEAQFMPRDTVHIRRA
eukprot:1158988-Pelagomonas_calceolata.AAC.10